LLVLAVNLAGAQKTPPVKTHQSTGGRASVEAAREEKLADEITKAELRLHKKYSETMRKHIAGELLTDVESARNQALSKYPKPADEKRRLKLEGQLVMKVLTATARRYDLTLMQIAIIQYEAKAGKWPVPGHPPTGPSSEKKPKPRVLR